MIVLPIAFVWYMNVSGLYQVLRDARARQKRQVAREEKREAMVHEHAA